MVEVGGSGQVCFASILPYGSYGSSPYDPYGSFPCPIARVGGGRQVRAGRVGWREDPTGNRKDGGWETGRVKNLN